MFEKFLQDIGFTDKEAKIYLALLSVENYSVIELSKQTGINRTTVYPVLEQLIKNGFVSEIKEGKKVNYQAEPPERLETFIEQQKIKLNEQSKVLQEIVPQMKGLTRQSGEKTIIKLYDGREGILKSIKYYFDADDTTGTAYLLYPRDLVEEFFSQKEITQSKEFRLQRGVATKSLYTYSKGELPYKSDNGERIKIDADKYPIKCDIGIYKDKIRIHTLGKNLSAIFIKDQDVADTFKSLFEMAFEAKKKEREGK